jgi:epoxyqueuosine reductase
MDLETNLRKIGENRNIDHFGIADLSAVRTYIKSHYGDQLLSYPKAISIGLNLFHDIVDQLPNRKQNSVSLAYKHHCYDAINNRLDLIVSEMSSFLQRLGHRVLPIPASQRLGEENLSSAFSHKLAANLAGLGWIGKSCLLVTPLAGPRVRFATILTNAPLESTGPVMENQCGECKECVTICPPQAFTGRAFIPTEERETRYDAFKCDEYFKSIRTINDWAACGLCLYVCPFGRMGSR